jgi:hypothetical protein
MWATLSKWGTNLSEQLSVDEHERESNQLPTHNSINVELGIEEEYSGDDEFDELLTVIEGRINTIVEEESTAPVFISDLPLNLYGGACIQNIDVNVSCDITSSLDWNQALARCLDPEFKSNKILVIGIEHINSRYTGDPSQGTMLRLSYFGKHILCNLAFVTDWFNHPGTEKDGGEYYEMNVLDSANMITGRLDPTIVDDVYNKILHSEDNYDDMFPVIRHVENGHKPLNYVLWERKIEQLIVLVDYAEEHPSERRLIYAIINDNIRWYYKIPIDLALSVRTYIDTYKSFGNTLDKIALDVYAQPIVKSSTTFAQATLVSQIRFHYLTMIH